MTSTQRALRDKLADFTGLPDYYCAGLFKSADGHLSWVFSGWSKLTTAEFLDPTLAFSAINPYKLPKVATWRPLALELLKEAQPL